MRISSLQVFNQGVEAFNRQQTKIAILQEQISTGNRLTKPSDDPAASARVLELEQTVSVNKQYNINITLAENRLRLEDTTLKALENTYFRMKELAIQAGNGINSSGALNSIKAEIKERFSELLSISNTRDNSGNYLFAGTSNAGLPFTKAITGSTEHVVYNGDQNFRSYQISETRQIKGDDNGKDLFLAVPSKYGVNESAAAGNNGAMSPAMVVDSEAFNPIVADPASFVALGPFTITFDAAGTTYSVTDSAANPALDAQGNPVTNIPYVDSAPIEFAGIRTSVTGSPTGDVYTVSQGQYRSIFETVEAFIDTLGDNDTTERSADLGSVMNDLDQFFENVLDVRTSVGGRMNGLTSQRDDNEAYIVSIQTTLASIRDTDLASAISQLTIEQTTLDAAQAVFSRITGSSLFDYLR